jgi:hypothetical protein
VSNLEIHVALLKLVHDTLNQAAAQGIDSPAWREALRANALLQDMQQVRYNGAAQRDLDDYERTIRTLCANAVAWSEGHPA